MSPDGTAFTLQAHAAPSIHTYTHLYFTLPYTHTYTHTHTHTPLTSLDLLRMAYVTTHACACLAGQEKTVISTSTTVPQIPA